MTVPRLFAPHRRARRRKLAPAAPSAVIRHFVRVLEGLCRHPSAERDGRGARR